MKTLLTEAQLRDGVRRLAREITAVYGEQPLTIVGVMTGSLVLLADLIRELSMPLRVGLVYASSYRGDTHRGDLEINSDLLVSIRQRDVLLVDDIFDTGHTLEKVIAEMWRYEPRSVRSAVLLAKRARQEVTREPDWVGFEIPDEFVVGYGLDYRDEYRNLPFVASLEAADLRDSEQVPGTTAELPPAENPGPQTAARGNRQE